MSAPVKFLYTAAEAASALALNTNDVYKLAAAGDLEKRYIGKGTRNFRIPAESLEAYAKGLPTEPREAS